MKSVKKTAEQLQSELCGESWFHSVEVAADGIVIYTTKRILSDKALELSENGRDGFPIQFRYKLALHK